ncbi:MAG: sigma 54-interacting transcriptional regulator [Kofleriaceae bacterium]
MPELTRSRSTQALTADDQDFFLVPQLRLRVLCGPDEGVSFRATTERLTMGTHKSAQWLFHDPTMSRFHCELASSPKGILVRDLESRNGTFVGDVRIETAYIRAGQILTLGNTQVVLEKTKKEIKVALEKRERFGAMVGRSHPMRALFATLKAAAASQATVLLQGETGSGKDLAAESVHLESDRRDGPFVVIDCGALAAGVLESELFGHEKGAFTGAVSQRLGAFEAARGGTLLLDEIGELPLDLQPKLLRVIETRKVQRLGSTAEIPLDVRLIAASNRNLRTEVNAKRFRSDLYFRLAVLETTIPPLRARLDDLPLLIEEILATAAAKDHPTAELFRRAPFQARLRTHSWPGNVRELRNYLERCLALQQPAPLQSPPEQDDDLPIDLGRPLAQGRQAAIDRYERRHLKALLRSCGGNVSKAARQAGLHRGYFYRLLARHGLA